MPTLYPSLTVQQDEQAIEREVLRSQQYENAAEAVEMADVSLIFLAKEFLEQFLVGVGHTIMYPVVAFAAVFRAALTIREAYLKQELNVIARAVVEAIAALALLVAVVGSFLATASFSYIAPLTFTLVFAGKALFNLVSSIYYGLKYLESEDSDEKNAYYQDMKSSLAQTLISSLSSLAAGLVFLAHHLSFGVLGFAAGAVGTGLAIRRAVTIKPIKSAESPVRASFKTTSVVADLGKGKGLFPAPIPLKKSSSKATMVVREPLTPRSDFMQNNNFKALSLYPDLTGRRMNVLNASPLIRQTSAESNRRVIKSPNRELRFFGAQRVSPQQEGTFQANLDLIHAKKGEIVSLAHALEHTHRLGARAAFNKLQGCDAENLHEIPTYHWVDLKNKVYNDATPELKRLLDLALEKITGYNALIKENTLVIQNENVKAGLQDSDLRRLEREKHERDLKQYGPDVMSFVEGRMTDFRREF